MGLHLFRLRERKNIFLAPQISEWQRGAVMAFISDDIVHYHYTFIDRRSCFANHSAVVPVVYVA